ncbi:MAG TPA: chorismate synthase [Anaerovoracaceae bacterium]|nr:chorismate synthase [Anaerovoracaceae bacterium]
MGSTWGNQLKISVFGESHGKGVGVVIDGFPAGFVCDQEFIYQELARRAPGQSTLTTGRKEEDRPMLLSGMLDNITTGAPICIMIPNTDTHSKDYENLRTVPRPSHSDYTGQLRYQGHNDIRGGGHFSGRLTAPIVYAGALCKDFLKKNHNMEIGSHIYRVGEITDQSFDLTSISREVLFGLQQETLPLLNREVEEKIKETVELARKELDSVGGIIECAVVGVAAGLGSPMFQNVESRIASILYSVPAVKGVEFGLGFAISEKRGSEANDCYIKDGGSIRTKTNYNGGISGGITTGMPIVVRAAFKPTPSISREQTTLNLETGKEEQLQIHGRHDPCIALRAAVVVEAAVAIAMMDLYLEAYGYDAK